MNVAQVVIVAAVTLILPVAHAQDGPGNATAGGGQAAGEAPDAWVVIGVALAAAAVAGTIWNGWQLRRHVSLVEADMSTRLRPVLGWTSSAYPLPNPVTPLDGDLIRIRIVNAGQAAAVGIECDVRYGMEGDFGAGREEHSRSQWGSLAPDKFIEIRVWVTEEQRRMAKEQKERLHIEIRAEYRDPGGKAYVYSMSGDYDGRTTVLRD